MDGAPGFSGWICVGRVEDIPENRGMTKAYKLGDGSGVLISRGDDLQLRAFENACRHRGHELVQCGDDCRGAEHHLPVPRLGLQARRLDARRPRLQATTRTSTSRSTACIDVPVQDWHGWIFVDPNRNAGPFEQHVGQLEDDRRRATTPRTCVTPSPTRTTWTPTGRSSSRTTRSATTARASTPSCAG